MKINKKEVAFYELEGLLEGFYVMVLDDNEIMKFYIGNYDTEEIMYWFCCESTTDEQEIIDMIEDDVDYPIKKYAYYYDYWDVQ